MKKKTCKIVKNMISDLDLGLVGYTFGFGLCNYRLHMTIMRGNSCNFLNYRIQSYRTINRSNHWDKIYNLP